MESNYCFWCGEKIGFRCVVIVIGGVKKRFHSNIFKDCSNEYNKWIVEQRLKGYIKEPGKEVI